MTVVYINWRSRDIAKCLLLTLHINFVVAEGLVSWKSNTSKYANSRAIYIHACKPNQDKATAEKTSCNPSADTVRLLTSTQQVQHLHYPLHVLTLQQ